VQAEIANHHPQPRGELRAAPGFEGPQSAKPFIAEPLAHEEKTVGHGISLALEQHCRLDDVRRVRFQEAGPSLLRLPRGKPSQNSRHRRFFHYSTLLTSLENAFPACPGEKGTTGAALRLLYARCAEGFMSFLRGPSVGWAISETVMACASVF